jgi:hypothetical protein
MNDNKPKLTLTLLLPLSREETRRMVSLQLPRTHKEAKRLIVDAFESNYLRQLRQRHRNNLSAMSRESRLSRRHLRELLRRYSLYGDESGGNDPVPELG